jgi:tyrosinase
MRLSTPLNLSFALIIASALTAPVPDDDSAALDLLNQLSQQATDNEYAALSNSTTKRSTQCTLRNISVRKEWYIGNPGNPFGFCDLFMH